MGQNHLAVSQSRNYYSEPHWSRVKTYTQDNQLPVLGRFIASVASCLL